ncbi:MAG: NAD-dependent succinate-semialdehyde dehydrogenase [Thermoplasmatota archaeon]
MTFETVNPATGQPIETYEEMPQEEVFAIAEKTLQAFLEWRKRSVSDRVPYMRRLADVLRSNQQEYAELMTTEMGKPIRESLAEVEKCAWMADVYAGNASDWLANEPVKADGLEHRVVFQPLGIILAIMPWNFPFWQALRCAVPALLAGNAVILKHARVCTGSGLAVEAAMQEAGFPEDVFRTVIADHATIDGLIASDLVQGVSLTGSVEAGRAVAATAGRHLKKMVLELGGSDPFIVLDDVDVEAVAEQATVGRMINTGQSCIAAKRFIVHEAVADAFIKGFAERMQQLRVGDPLDMATEVGPLVDEASLEQMEAFIRDAVEKGATVVTGGAAINRAGFFFEPTVLADVTRDMRVAREEVFGPVAPVFIVEDEEQAVALANGTPFGLGGSVWTRDEERGMNIARRVDAGCVFVNHITKSDPRLPFGGIKKSGVGRELARYGLHEFVNVKTLNLYRHG